MMTVGAPGPMTDPPAPVGSPTRAAGTPPSKTAVDPMITASTPQLLPRHAAGNPPMRTVGAPGVTIGTGAPYVALLTIMSVTRAARDTLFSPIHDSSCVALFLPPDLRLSRTDLRLWPLHHRHAVALDGRHAAGQFRGTGTGRLERGLRAKFHVLSRELHVVGRLEHHVFGALDLDALVVEGDLVAVLVFNDDALGTLGQRDRIPRGCF